METHDPLFLLLPALLLPALKKKKKTTSVLKWLIKPSNNAYVICSLVHGEHISKQDNTSTVKLEGWDKRKKEDKHTTR